MRPVRRPHCPVMNDERPAVQLCSAVRVSEAHAFVCDAVDVWRLVAHHALGVAAEVRLTDVVSPHHEDVRFVSLWSFSQIPPLVTSGSWWTGFIAATLAPTNDTSEILEQTPGGFWSIVVKPRQPPRLSEADLLRCYHDGGYAFGEDPPHMLAPATESAAAAPAPCATACRRRTARPRCRRSCPSAAPGRRACADRTSAWPWRRSRA